MRPKHLFECKHCGKLTDSTLGPVGSCPEREHLEAMHQYEVVA